MHYKPRSTPGEPEAFSKNKHMVTLSKNNSNIKEEDGTRPDIRWAVTRVSWTTTSGESEQEADEQAR
eukprot:12911543-Prorocentrum_lima.AAC.1